MELDAPKIRPLPASRSLQCGICLEENVVCLLLVGCSNHHLICHPCARSLVSANVTMSRFPQYIPGHVRLRQDLHCPQCRESLHGLTNLFVDIPPSCTPPLTCPYVDMLSETECQHLSCFQPWEHPLSLRQHLIEKHNQAVKCPHCAEWLCQPQQNMENTLLSHVVRHCQHIPCGGCDRLSTMPNLLLHSKRGTDIQTCHSARSLFQTFGRELANAFYLFDQPQEDLTDLGGFLFQTTIDYLLLRAEHPLTVRSRCLWEILQQLYESVCQVADEDPSLLDLLHLGEEHAYQEGLMKQIAVVAEQYDTAIMNADELPFFLKLLFMTLGRFSLVEKWQQEAPSSLVADDQFVVNQVCQLYEQLIPEPLTAERIMWPG